MNVARHTRSEDLLRHWLLKPWVSFEEERNEVERAGLLLLDDPRVVAPLEPKGLIRTIETAVVKLDDDHVSFLVFGELDLGRVSVRDAPFIREFWLLDATDERPWFEFLSEVYDASPHPKDEPTIPPIRSWFWINPLSEDQWVRLTPYPGGGTKISQVSGVVAALTRHRE